MTAFTLGADHAAQLAVWRQVKEHSYIQPYTVKRLLTESAVPLDSDLGLFVGAAAYEAAGGHVTRDLFSGDEDGFLDDAALVHRLAIEKLEAKAAELRSQWAWTRAVLDPEYGFLAQYAARAAAAGRSPARARRRDRAHRAAPRRARRDRRGRVGPTSSRPRRRSSRNAAPRSTRRSTASRSTATRTAPAPAASSRSAMTANSACIKGLVERTAPRGPAGDAGDRPDDDGDEGSIPPAPTTRTRQSHPVPRAPAPSRRCARNAASARCWSTISRRTGCRSPAPISRGISTSRSIWRSMRCASICSTASATTRTRSICGRSRRRRAARSTISPAPRPTGCSRRTAARSISTG